MTKRRLLSLTLPHYWSSKVWLKSIVLHTHAQQTYCWHGYKTRKTVKKRPNSFSVYPADSWSLRRRRFRPWCPDSSWSCSAPRLRKSRDKSPMPSKPPTLKWQIFFYLIISLQCVLGKFYPIILCHTKSCLNVSANWFCRQKYLLGEELQRGPAHIVSSREARALHGFFYNRATPKGLMGQ